MPSETAPRGSSGSSSSSSSLDDFLAPLHIDLDKAHDLSQLFLDTFRELSATSETQFLPTPISESVLRPISDRDHGRHLAIDIGGTNLRVGFIELLGKQVYEPNDLPPNGHLGRFAKPTDRTQRHLEQSWPIHDHLKSANEDELFLWIGRCISEVVAKGCETLDLPRDETLPLGVTFSFPMEQDSLSEATVMAMGKGFAVGSNTDLGLRLQEGYEKAVKGQSLNLPSMHVAAIANDSVSTLVSFIFRYDENVRKRAAMGLILGTGCNATIPLKLSTLHPNKRPSNVSLLPGEKLEDARIAVNTEWSINGSAPPLRQLGLISQWDEALDSQNETPGFQPLEYMTAGRYLGELGRIMLLDYLTNVLGSPQESLPEQLLRRDGLTTTFLSHFKPLRPAKLVLKLQEAYPESTSDGSFTWTEEAAEALYRIAKAIEVRAAGVMAAATIALLDLAGELPTPEDLSSRADKRPHGVGVGYTGGCIVHFQDYLADCQEFIDQLVARRFSTGAAGSNGAINSDGAVDENICKVALSPCHDGGITGAGILVAAAAASKSAKM